MYRDPRGLILPDQGIGGGAPLGPAAIDPNGLVPINRSQPMANDQFETQRLMENRLGAMPPSSFSGSGGGFVPVNRPSPVQGEADARTDMAMFPGSGKRAELYSREAIRRANMAQRLARMGGLLGASVRRG